MIGMNGEPVESPDDGEPKAAQAPREPHVITCQVCRTMWDATPAWDAGMATACPSCAKDRRIKQLEAERADLLARSGPCPNCLDLAQRVTVVEKVLRGFIVPGEFEKAWREVRGPIVPRQKLVDYGITGDTPLPAEWFNTPVDERQMHIDDFNPESGEDQRR